jgi:hypothetical protein
MVVADSLRENNLSIPTWADFLAEELADQSITALPSNHQVMAVGFDFACGLRPYVGVGGPCGWGKSGMLDHIACATRQISDPHCQRIAAVEWINSQTPPDRDRFLIIDDVQDTLRQPRYRHQLKVRLESRLARRRPTLFGTTGGFQDLIRHGIIRPGSDWQLSEVQEPTAEERQHVARFIAIEQSMELHPSIESLIATHLNGNGRSIRGALLRLKLIKDDWKLESDILGACGVLMPYLIGEDGWDPRDVVAEAVTFLLLSCETPPLGKRAIIAYSLNRLIRLPEVEVARFLRISTGQVYRHCRNVKERLAQPETAEFMNLVKAHVLTALSQSAQWMK